MEYFFCEKKYVFENLDELKKKDCNVATNPFEVGLKLHKDEKGNRVNKTLYKQIISSLMYLNAILDVIFSVNLKGRYMKNPIKLHIWVAMRIIRYV